MDVVGKRFGVYLVNLDPTVGSEIQKTRPCVVVSPDEMNRYIRTVIVAPLTSRGRLYPTRIRCTFDDRAALIFLDQIRTVDISRLVRRLGQIDPDTMTSVLTALGRMFAP